MVLGQPLRPGAGYQCSARWCHPCHPASPKMCLVVRTVHYWIPSDTALLSVEGRCPLPAARWLQNPPAQSDTRTVSPTGSPGSASPSLFRPRTRQLHQSAEAWVSRHEHPYFTLHSLPQGAESGVCLSTRCRGSQQKHILSFNHEFTYSTSLATLNPPLCHGGTASVIYSCISRVPSALAQHRYPNATRGLVHDREVV